MSDSDSEVEVHVLDDGPDETTSTSKQQETPNTFGRSLMMKILGIATGAEGTGIPNVNKSIITVSIQSMILHY